MPDRFGPGHPVRVHDADRSSHTRAPRYVRGHTGVVVEVHGHHALPDDVVAGVAAPRVEPVYAVRFPARELWGSGDHSITVNLWESYLSSTTVA